MLRCRSVPRIERIHWGRVGQRGYRDACGSLFALWPEPIDADRCFDLAGFDGFEDSDEIWNADFESLLETVLVTLRQYGRGVTAGERPVVDRSLLDRLARRCPSTLELSAHLALVAMDDSFAPCRVDFGDPVCAVLVAGDGHPIVWIWLHEEVAGAWREHVARIASGRPLVETNLDWEVLLPRGPFQAAPLP